MNHGTVKMSGDQPHTPVFNFVPSDSPDFTGAACASDGVGPMFPHNHDLAGIAYAKRICAGCPIRDLCLWAAIDNNEAFGIWGGLTPDERRTIKRRDARIRLAAAQLEREAG